MTSSRDRPAPVRAPHVIRLEHGTSERLVFLAASEVTAARLDALSAGERAIIARTQIQKRRDEFCAGRRAARQAIAWAGVASSEYEILARPAGQADEGRPVLTPDQGVCVSISHSGAWAIAAAAKGPAPLGIDLEPAKLLVDDAFVSEAFADGELAQWQLPAELTDARVSIAWAAKEAVLKVWGVGLRAPLASVSLRPGPFRLGDAGWHTRISVQTSVVNACIVRSSEMIIVVAT